MKKAALFAIMLLSCLVAVLAAAPDKPDWLPASHDNLPRWRGFNLLEKFDRAAPERNRPFREEDFKLIAELGFNFARLPMDYRTWIVGANWRRFDEKTLKEIDDAVRWGRQYGVHVCLNFHRAPGHTVAMPREERDLWTDTEVQEVCALHWAMFARRYKGVPSEQLSFNLFNEPIGVDAATHAQVVRKMTLAIRKEDPDRLIICDGLGFGLTPCPELKPLRVAQSLRGYLPFALTHYRAEWVGGSDGYAQPVWPTPVLGSVLYGPRGELPQPAMTFIGHLYDVKQVLVQVGWIPDTAVLAIEANNQPVLRSEINPHSLRKDWEEVPVADVGKVYANVKGSYLAINVPPRTTRLALRCDGGTWLALREIQFIDAKGRAHVLRPWVDASLEQVPVFIKREVDGISFVSSRQLDQKWLWVRVAAPWKDMEKQGIGVMVGEFGVYNKTPHDVALAWLEDNLKTWQQARWGWALWNFRGPFGLLDSEREDVEYENFRGHKLDRKMLELLQRY